MTDIKSTNMERTAEYLAKFNREKVLKFLIKNNKDINITFCVANNVVFDMVSNLIISSNKNNVKCIYDLSGKIVNDFKPNKIYIVQLNDNSLVKIFINGE